jgi:MFS family permease
VVDNQYTSYQFYYEKKEEEMRRRRRGGLAIGMIMILIGGWFLAVQVIPGLDAWVDRNIGWPWIVIGIGLVFLVFGIFAAPGLAIPAAIISGIGGILYYQNLTGDYESWAYLWTLIPGFVGVGVIVTNLIQGRIKEALRDGWGSIFISLVLFAIFGSAFGDLAFLGKYWPVLLILAGLVSLLRVIFGSLREK